MNKLFTLLCLILLTSCTQLSDTANTAPTNLQHPEIKALGDRLADWQLAHMDDFSYIRTFQDHTAWSKGWVQAAFYIGLNRWASRTNNTLYQQAMYEKAQANQWELGPLYWHADDQAVAQMYLALPTYGFNIDSVKIQQAFDKILSVAPDNSLEFFQDKSGKSEGTCQWRWCWCDALFMAPPAWAALSQQTGDERYLEYAIKEYRATREYLLDKEHSLFYRDSRFFDRVNPNGNKIFWSRGNGWVFAGLPLLLENMPVEHPAREEFLALYRAMAKTFIGIQTAEGYYSSSLLDFDNNPPKETSGTAFITFGLAWGLNNGILQAEEYKQSVQRSWALLSSSVNNEGMLTWVQQVGFAPDSVLESDTQLYGSGAFLLAASEMLALKNAY